MNKWRVGGLVVAAALIVLVLARSCAPEKAPAPAPKPAREAFHASKPLLVSVKADTADKAGWLERELRNLLLRGRMSLAAAGPQKIPAFTLQLELERGTPARAKLALQAPDGVIERSATLELNTSSRLGTIQDLARQLPEFLQAAHTAADWVGFPGTQDAAAYENFLLSADELFGSNAAGFTQPPAANLSATVERLEALTRKQPGFTRANAMLAISYLSLGGEDSASLTQLAETTAQRVLSQDAALADAHSALGLVSLRRGEWVAAKEHFDAALALDANALPALEGLGCLLMNAGQVAAALPIASRAVALQASNVGANECLAYAQLATGTLKTDEPAGKGAAEIARVQALAAILSGDIERARHALQATQHADAWLQPLLSAAEDKSKTSDALRAITLAASDRRIDPATEILAGAALRQSEFVFNRMQRLHKQKQSVPLRILWLPQTDFLRRNPRFEQIVTAEALLPFWQEHGLPDLCSSEPDLHGCKTRALAAQKADRK